MPAVLDRLLAALGLLVLSPLILAAAIWIKLDSRGPVLYRQRRVGKDGHAFEMLKLRTMKEGSDPEGVGTAVLGGDPRVTASGRVLRRTSLDEIPNLVNVLRGEMAIVGPRPTLNAHVDHFALHGHPRFDGHGPGWLVYPPNSRHVPTVTGGRMLIAYFLPAGEIVFDRLS